MKTVHNDFVPCLGPNWGSVMQTTGPYLVCELTVPRPRDTIDGKTQKDWLDFVA